MGIFKACDVRGRYGQDLTVELAGHLGRAVGTELGGSAVVVGGDLRLSTAPLKRAIIEGLMAAGCRVVDLGVLPTPAFYFARDLLHIEGAVMVTGSHNPPDDNGFKICLGPHPITEEEIAALERRVQSGDFGQGVGAYDRHNVVGPYQEHIQQAFPAGGRLSVVVDAGNGCYSSIAPGVLRRLGYGVTELFCEPDGRFPDRSPNPAVAENLRSLCALVTEVSADMGVAYDGDGDRAVFVDNRGRVVSSDVSIVLFARHLLRR
ncbi:MAG: phosphomannomutase/phosphoglucomutase, partial [Anaerolineales bacterium]|nr:phosphomannomutase/phosphoglucomutase [Anaerolineales bacterium]